MSAYLIKFFFGVIILLLATQLFVKLAVKLSEAFRLSPLVIGMLVVSFGTTLPELSVAITSTSSGSVGLAAGTIIGSTIVNFILVLPAAILLGRDIRIGTTKTQKNAIVLIIATLLFVLLQQLPIPPVVSGIILLSGLVVSNYLEYRWGTLGRLQEDKTVIDLFKKRKVTPDLVFGLFFSVICVTIGGLLVVRSMEDLAILSGYSTTVLGLTLTGIATSLPDIFTAVMSQKKDEDKLTIGHITGGSLYNLLFIGGVANILGADMNLGLNEVLFLFGSVLLFFLIIKFYRDKNIPKWIGLVLLILFFIYIYSFSF